MFIVDPNKTYDCVVGDVTFKIRPLTAREYLAVLPPECIFDGEPVPPAVMADVVEIGLVGWDHSHEFSKDNKENVACLESAEIFKLFAEISKLSKIGVDEVKN